MADARGPKDPYVGLHAEAIYAMWHDPLTYDPIKHGPPYLPEMKVKRASDNVHLTPKEIGRASGGYTIIVRPQAGGGYLVAAVEIEGNTGKIVPVHQEIVENQSGIAHAVQEINRWLDKLGYPIEMAQFSRDRQQWKAACDVRSTAWKA